MKKRIFNLVLTIALMAVGAFAVAHRALATTVSPVLIEHTLAPGESAEGKMWVINSSQTSQTYHSVIQKFVPVGELGQQKFLDENDVSGLPSWINIAKPQITINPRDKAEIDYTVTIPADAAPGGYYAAVFFADAPPAEDNNTSGSGITSKTGILFLVTVKGDIIESAELESFNIQSNFMNHLPAYYSIRVSNMGNAHIRPQGTIDIRNVLGGVVAQIPANPSESSVLPNSTRRLDAWWYKSTNITGATGFINRLRDEWRNFAFGRYTATLNVNYGSKHQMLPAEVVTFWVFPWHLFLVLIVLIIAGFIIVKIYNKMVILSAVKKSKAHAESKKAKKK